MLFTNTTAQEVSELIGQNIILVTKEDSDLEISEDIDETLLLSFKKNISVASNKLKVTNSVEVFLKNLPLIITHPIGLLFKINIVPELYCYNFRCSYESFKANLKTENDRLYYIHIQQLNIKLEIDRTIYKETIIKAGEPIAKLYFIPLWTCRTLNPHVYFLRDSEYYEQLLIKKVMGGAL